MACIYIINGKKFSEIDQSAIDELIKADLIEPNSAKTIAMAYQIAKEDNTNPDFTDKIDAILNNSPQQSEQTQDTPQAEVKTETPKDEYTRKLYLAKYLRALTNKQFTLQEWEKASIITSNVAEKEQLLKLAK